ncbi:site-specific DNA-methyltransferase [Vibrio sp. Vb1026]|uniref:site-specific DNA-methyltransferase n=1 Tax=Vibrio sp. Vb1026 TaxID=3074637 RepID=UPI0029653102|nr:site-specific DNA-methyltransferase [Vibrio sp. Vb1026]MDW1875396.1 site-specific DNA-methyltransferase [Vibrio sp. Vb1026]
MTTTIMDGSSLDISAQRKQELKQLFPSVFTETRNDAGEIVETLDFERLKAELGSFSEVYDNRRERYSMEWPGKRDCLRLIQEPSHATLKPCLEESVDFDNTENIFIEGDNLEVLKLLQKSYYGQVKMIYIDPPYNTGKEFIYPDNFSENLDTYLEYAGLKEVGGEGKKWSSNSENEGRFHTKWLNMMYPRLYLARNLLREDGVIFISIDDNEVENLRRLCDEIFGEENCLAQFSWRTDGNFDNQAKIKNCHEYILMYCRDAVKFPHPPVIDPNTRENSKLFNTHIVNTIVKNGPKNPVSEVVLPKGFPSRFIDGSISARTDSWPHYKSDATFQGGKLTKDVAVQSGWSSKELLLEFIQNNFLPITDSKGQKTRFEVTATGAIEYIKERNDVQSHVISSLNGFGGSQKAQSEIEELEVIFDDYPKPTSLIEYFIRMQGESEFIVLDFFAGSATTAHSVYNVSVSDNQDIKFILVQLPEPTKAGSKAKKDGFNYISDIAKERIRRAGQKIRTELERRPDSDSKPLPDLGFKVFKLDQSNFKQWQAPGKDVSDEELLSQMELLVEHVEPDVSQEDLLYELLIKAGIMPTEKVETIELAGQSLFSVAEGALLIHLAETISKPLIDAVLELAPSQFICLDSAFHGNDQLKANTVQTFNAYNQSRDKIEQIEFKTV